MITLENYRVIKVKYLSPTNHIGSRVRLTETKRGNDDVTIRKTLSYDNNYSSVVDQVIDVLTKAGFNPVGMASDVDQYYIFCDAWRDAGEEYKTLKDIK